MTEFERGIRRALEIYKAGASGLPVPKYDCVRQADTQELYTQGYIDFIEEIERCHDPKQWEGVPIERLIRR